MMLISQSLTPKFSGSLSWRWEGELPYRLGRGADKGFNKYFGALAGRFQKELPTNLEASVIRQNKRLGIPGDFGYNDIQDTVTLEFKEGERVLERKKLSRRYNDAPHWFGKSSNRGFTQQIYEAALELCRKHIPGFEPDIQRPKAAFSLLRLLKR